MSESPQEFKKILIILPRQLGDILLGSSIAFALRHLYPNAHITWIAHPMGRQLLEGHPALNEVVYYPVRKRRGIKNLLTKPLDNLRDLIRYLQLEFTFLKQLRASGFDFVADAICTPKTAIMTRLTSAGVRHGVKTRWNRDWAYTRLCDTTEWKNYYAAHARLRLLSPFLANQLIDEPPAEWLNSWIPAPVPTQERMNDLIRQLGLAKNNFVVLSPTSRRPLRQWPAEHFVELALRLITQDGLKVCWFWGPGELEFVHSIHASLSAKLKEIGITPESSVVPPLLTLSEAAVFSAEGLVWIGNTNGLSHVAVAGGARTVQIFGPTSAINWTHPDRNMHIPVQRSQGCVRCESNHCKTGTHECMKMLSVDEVLSAVRAIKTV
ncbi:MAG: hypothetical protein RLZZ488_1726 [Pseudomonadota bacterium]